jgi:hypothetical protein
MTQVYAPMLCDVNWDYCNQLKLPWLKDVKSALCHVQINLLWEINIFCFKMRWKMCFNNLFRHS